MDAFFVWLTTWFRKLTGQAFLIMQSLIFCGFKRIGWNQEKKFIHCDIDADKPQRVLFSY